MYEINSIGAKYTEHILDNIEYFHDYFKEMKDKKSKFVFKMINYGYTIIDTDCSWFFLKRFDSKDNLKYFNDLGMSFRTLTLPDGEEYIKFNYDLNLDNVL